MSRIKTIRVAIVASSCLLAAACGDLKSGSIDVSDDEEKAGPTAQHDEPEDEMVIASSEVSSAAKRGRRAARAPSGNTAKVSARVRTPKSR